MPDHYSESRRVHQSWSPTCRPMSRRSAQKCGNHVWSAARGRVAGTAQARYGWARWAAWHL